jgi:adenosine deaminase
MIPSIGKLLLGFLVMDMVSFAANAPKAELHIHIEGSFEPELMFALARRNGIRLPYSSVEDLRHAYNFSNLQEFLDIYYQGMAVLRREEDFFDLTMAYLQRAAADNVIHTEIFFDPQAHLERGIAFAEVIKGIHQALQAGKTRFGLSSRLIMCFLRHLSEESALATLAEAESFLPLIDGVGLDSSEKDHPPRLFTAVFARARALGLHVVAHAGEEGPPSYVREALDLLQVERIDHGNRALEDPGLTRHLAETAIPLTVCPLSNLKLRVIPAMRRHPLKTMLDAGLVATVNSDDPAYFGGYVNDNYAAVIRALGLERKHVETLLRNSFTTAFVPAAEKNVMLARLERYFSGVRSHD